MLDEIHLIDVPALDCRAHRRDRGRVAVVVPAALPLAAGEASTPCASPAGRPDPAREERQRTRLGRRRRRLPAERGGEAETEVEVGDEVVALPELPQVLLEPLERAVGFVEL
jgi:hypothetical protein